MSFAERFKGKVTIIGKEGTIATLDENISGVTNEVPSVSKSIIQLPPKPTNYDTHPHKPKRNKESSFHSVQAISHKYAPTSNPSPQIHKFEKKPETPTLKISIPKQELKSNLQKIGYDYICQPYSISRKYFPSAPNTNLTSGLSSKGMNYLNIQSAKNETEYSVGYKPYTLKEYKDAKATRYVQMGGLGPNIGSLEWREKQNLRKEMIEFGTKITAINKGKLLILPKRALSPKKESNRDKALEYSKKLKQMVKESVAIPSYSRQIEQDLNNLQEQHDALAKEIERIKAE